MSYKLDKPYSDIERADFIVQYNHNMLLKIYETQTALYALEPHEKLVDDVVVDNSIEYNKEQERIEKERIAMLNLTGADVERAIYKAKGMDFNDIIAFLEAQPLSQDGTPVVDLHDNKIVSRLQSVGHLHLKRRESSLMSGNLFAVEIDPASVAHSPEIQELSSAVGRSGIEMPCIPHSPFVIFQFWSLGVPVARDVETETTLKRIFVELLPRLRCPVLIDLHFPPLVIKVHDGIPLPVEQSVVTSVDIGHERGTTCIRAGCRIFCACNKRQEKGKSRK